MYILFANSLLITGACKGIYNTTLKLARNDIKFVIRKERPLKLTMYRLYALIAAAGPSVSAIYTMSGKMHAFQKRARNKRETNKDSIMVPNSAL